jgi:hypothetical protein
VHTRVLDVRFTVEPAAIMPTERSDPPVPLVTVLPLEVVVDTGAGAGAGRVRTGVLTTGAVARRGAVARGVGDVGAGAVGAGATVPAGTSDSCGCAALSALASWRSRLSAVSCARESLVLLSLHALNAVKIDSASGAIILVTVLDISVFSIFMWLLPKPLYRNLLDPLRGQSVCHL